MKLSLKSTLISISLGFLLSGCIATKSYDFKPTEKEMMTVSTNKEVDIKITAITSELVEEEKRGDIDAPVNIVLENIKSNLDNAIIESNIFNLSSNNNAEIQIIVYKVDSPIFSSSFPTDMKVQYIVKTNNQVIFNETIESKGETEMSFSFLGGTRQMESVNRSARQNIVKFLNAIQLKIGK